MSAWVYNDEHYIIQDLPNEVLLGILRFLSTHHLLRGCRLVSKLWNDTAASICRRREVRICTDFISRASTALESIQDQTNFPWSSAHFNRPTLKRSVQLSQLIGINLKVLVLTMSAVIYKNVLKVLKNTPNLQQLSIHLDVPVVNVQFTPSANLKREVKLPGLQVFSVHLLQPIPSVDLFKFILEDTEAKLTSFEVQLGKLAYHEQSLFLEIAQLIGSCSAKTISLDLFYSPNAGWNHLAAQEHLNIRSLKVVQFEIDPALDPGRYQPLELVLRKCSNHLNTLALVGFSTLGSHAESSPLLRLPKLSSLRTLELSFNSYQFGNVDSDPSGQSMFYFYPVKVNQLPLLENVKIICNPRWEVNLPFTTVTKLFGGGIPMPFNSVKHLEIDQYNGGGPKMWIEVFPNLTNVTVTIRDSDGLKNLFLSLNYLEVVTLEFNVVVGGDVNSIIAHAFHRSRDVFEFESLRTLALRNKTALANKWLKDFGLIYFGFLPPLDSLTIFTANTEVTESCLTMLRGRHRQVLLKDD